MLTRKKKKQKIEHKKLDILVAVFSELVEYMGINDISNLNLVCKELHSAVKNTRDASSWNIVSEKRERTVIGYQAKKFDEDYIPLHDVTVSQVQPFKFCISKNNNELRQHAQKLVATIHLENELWEEDNNQKIRDLEVSEQATRISICVYTYEGEEVVFKFYSVFGGGDIFLPFMTDREAEYGLWLEKFQENGSEEHKTELRRILSIMYVCVKRISSWKGHTPSSYPTAEYLMRLLPPVVWPFFPEDFDWEANHSDWTTVPEFTYHPAPNMEEWLQVVPPGHFLDGEGIANWVVDTLPWYNGQDEF